MFTSHNIHLHILDFFVEINRSDVKDTEMDFTINTIVEGLFSYFVTLGR